MLVDRVIQNQKKSLSPWDGGMSPVMLRHKYQGGTIHGKVRQVQWSRVKLGCHCRSREKSSVTMD